MNDIEEVNQETVAEFPERPLIITEDIRSYMYDMVRWTKFLAIVGFVFTALIAMMGIGAGAFIKVMTAMSPGSPLAALGTGFLTVYFLLIALLYFYPSFLLLKHSNAAKKAILYGEQEGLSAAMLALKSFFKFWGILMIILIALYGLIIVGSIAAGIGSGMAG